MADTPAEQLVDLFVTRAEFVRFKRQVVKYLDKRFGEMYEEMHKIDDAESAIADEAIEKAERAQRHARRIEKKLEEHTHD